MKLRMIHDRILVEVEAAPGVSDTGVILPPAFSCVGRVLAVGPEVTDARQGERVRFELKAGEEFATGDGRTLRVLAESQCLLAADPSLDLAYLTA